MSASVVELGELAVNGLKALSGYDRVMAYRFFEDGHGEVIAEARDAPFPAYLGQHYPAMLERLDYLSCHGERSIALEALRLDGVPPLDLEY